MEHFKDILGYEGLYQISNLGKVKSVAKLIDKGKWGNVLFPEIILKQLNRNGYLAVNLYKNKKPKTTSMHRIIAIAFIPNPENKPFINHKNGIKTDNSIENLEWCTPKENGEHASANGLINKPTGEKNGQSKLTEHAVSIIRESRYKISRKKLSEMFGVSVKHVDRIRSKERWSHV